MVDREGETRLSQGCIQHNGPRWSHFAECRRETKQKVVRPERFELPTFWFVARRSIQLSYGRIFLNKLYYAASCRSTELPDLLVSAAGGLYPAELRAQIGCNCVTTAYSRICVLINREFRRIRRKKILISGFVTYGHAAWR
jgi:hypothetical protein